MKLKFVYGGFCISGALKKEVEAIKYAIDFVLSGVAPRKLIPIIITKSKKDLGENQGQFSSEYVIHVLRRDTCKVNGSWLSTLVHELVHAKQVMEGRLLTSDFTKVFSTLGAYITEWYELQAFATQFKYRREIENDQYVDTNAFAAHYLKLGIRC